MSAGNGAAQAQNTAPPARSANAIIADDYDALSSAAGREPSNLDISFRFAVQAVARGDYEAAISTLERMLYFKAHQPRVKLELGMLYLKLGHYGVAKDYFEDAVKGGGIPPHVVAQAQSYLAAIARRTP